MISKYTFTLKDRDDNVLTHKNALWVYIIRPYKELGHNGNLVAAVLWFVFTIFAAQMGTFVNIIKHVLFHDGRDVPLVASVLSPLFIQLIEEKDIHFKRPKVFSIVICIFTLFFGGVFFSFSALNPNAYDGLKDVNFCVDKSQLFFFVFSIVVASYAFALTRMDKERNKDIDDYLSDQKTRIETLSKEEVETIEDDIKVK